MTSNRSIHLVDEESTFAGLRAAEKAACARRNALAAKTVAGYSKDAAECEHLLAMLGLDPAELK